MFGNLRRDPGWTEDAITVGGRTRNLKEPTISAAGIDAVKVGTHYDVIVCDDLHSQLNVTTPEQIRKVVEYYRLILSLLEPRGDLIVVGTRWHYSDPYDSGERARGLRYAGEEGHFR